MHRAVESRKCYEVCRKYGKPDNEMEAVRKVQEIFKGMNLIPCTACRYCEAGCPKKIAIPDLFAVMNTKQIYHDWNADYYYNNFIPHREGRRQIV